MPRFFFDLTDKTGHHYDSTGLDLADVNAAQQVLEMSLPRLSADRAVGAGSSMTLTMIVRDSFDQELLCATLDWTIRTRRLGIDRRQSASNNEPSLRNTAQRSDGSH